MVANLHGINRTELSMHRPKAPAERHRKATGQGGPRPGGKPGKRRVPAVNTRGPPAVPGLGFRAGLRAKGRRGESVCHGVEST